MLTILLIILAIVLIAGLVGGPRYYRGRRTIVERDYDL
jgi:hypothetical protein